ncbi:MAG: hypothetical protein QXJ55_09735 [Candidatus Caldarchaeum sp.]
MRIPSGVAGLDRLLGGGWAAGKTNIVYGPPSSLKTIICLATARLFASRGGVPYYIDTEAKTSPDPSIIHHEALEIQQVLDRLVEIKARTRFINPHLTLVVIDSLTAPLHHLYLQHPQYASQKQRALNHLLNQLNSEGVTVLATSWLLREGYTGKSLNPAVVVRVRKTVNRLVAVLERSDETLVGSEEIDVSEVLKAAAV